MWEDSHWDETIAAARANVVATKALKIKMINEMLGIGSEYGR
jgi:hypothetical protein